MKKHLKDKMMLSYLLDGEQWESEWKTGRCYCCKTWLSLVGEIMGVGLCSCPNVSVCDTLNSWLTIGSLIYYIVCKTDLNICLSNNNMRGWHANILSPLYCEAMEFRMVKTASGNH